MALTRKIPGSRCVYACEHYSNLIVSEHECVLVGVRESKVVT